MPNYPKLPTRGPEYPALSTSDTLQPEPRSTVPSEVSPNSISIQEQDGCAEATNASNVESAIAKDNNWTRDDVFMVDIELSEKRVTPSQRFRGWLSRYQYAESYLNWAETTSSHPRTAFLILDPKDADNRGKGRLNEYLTAIHRQDTKHRRAIQYGLKYHAFEHIYGNPGVSTILCQVFTTFQNLSYLHFHSLAEAIRQSSDWSGLAERKANWLSKCQSSYYEDCMRYEQERGRKHSLRTEGSLEQGRCKWVRQTLPTITGEASATVDVLADLSLDNTLINQTTYEDLDPSQSPDVEQDGDRRLSMNNESPQRDFSTIQDFDLRMGLETSL